MLQLARVQDQMNHHLQHIQQGQLNMQAHAGALQQLADSTHQWNYDRIFASIPIYNGSNNNNMQSQAQQKQQQQVYLSAKVLSTSSQGIYAV